MNNPRLGFLTPSGIFAAGLTILIVVGIGLVQGGMLFNPGPLNAHAGPDLGGVTSHADLGGRCSACHAPFWGPENMPDRCLKCHTGVAAELQTPQSLHGVLQQGGFAMTCRDCHPEHLGPAAPVTVFDTSTFPHDVFGFALLGKHAPVTCIDCHPDHVYVSIPTGCASCHAREDTHQGRLGTNCERCHSPSGWKPSTFDHNSIAFKLEGKHATAACEGCHVDRMYRGTPTECASCHAKDDIHQGKLGVNCGDCHIPAGWVPSTFDHNSIAFKLEGKHLTVACGKCHADKFFKGTPNDCYSCHAKDDSHNGELGAKCETCHVPAGWKPSTFDHNSIAFKLNGQHAVIPCSDCHAGKSFKGIPSTCFGCHAKDDKHKGRFGQDCSLCHSTSAWKPSTFSHLLVGGNCYACHAADDHHGGRFGTACGLCHSTNAWLPASFDHTFAGNDCYSCHAGNDPHGGAYGTGCAQCHNTSSWAFSHPGNCVNHQNATCAQCHPGGYLSNSCTACHENRSSCDGDGGGGEGGGEH